MIKFIDIRNFLRGHEIKLDDSLVIDKNITLLEYNKQFGTPKWIYCDNLQLTNESRPCKKCGLSFEFNTPDICIGYINGANGACCGHGDDKKKYVNILDEDTNEILHLRGEEYELYMKFKNYKEFKNSYLTLHLDKKNLDHLQFKFQIKNLQK